MANSVWMLSDELMVEHMITYRETNARNLLLHMMEAVPHDEFTRMSVTLWAIWTARRKAIHEDIFQSPLSTHGFVTSFLNELKSLATGKSQPIIRDQVPHRGAQVSWIPPVSDMPKINVDASLSKTSAKGVDVAFCRSCDCVYLGASTVVFNGITDPAILEALACRDALALADDLVLNRLHVASDCKQVVTNVKEGSLGKYGAVITEIKARTTQFIHRSFAYEGRAHNYEAHNLARHALTLDAGR
jgi:hypothetical protein